MKNMTILIVDDDELVLKSLTRSLRKQPFNLKTCATADEAMTLMGATTFDVVISDNWMRGTNGTEFLEWVAQHYPNTARIVITGAPGLLAMEHKDVKASHVLAKPVDQETLVNAIVEAYESRTLHVIDYRAPSMWNAEQRSQ